MKKRRRACLGWQTTPHSFGQYGVPEPSPMRWFGRKKKKHIYIYIYIYIMGFGHLGWPNHPHGPRGWFGYHQWSKPIKKKIEGLPMGWLNHPQGPKPIILFYFIYFLFCHVVAKPPQFYFSFL
jgi:hypothetical protein